jgi:methyltransferase
MVALFSALPRCSILLVLPTVLADSHLLFAALFALLALQRLGELVLAQRNRSRLLAAGAFEVGASHYPVMVLLHAGWLFAAPLEVFFFDRPFLPGLGGPALAVAFAAMALRVWVIRTLGPRWTTRVIVLPGAAPVVGGPYRYLSHPNYLAVVVELAAFPLVHTAWLSALVFTLGNALLLRTRIRVEEEALRRVSSWGEELGSKPRLVPELRS